VLDCARSWAVAKQAGGAERAARRVCARGRARARVWAADRPAGSRFGPKLEGRPGCGVTGQARLAGRVIGLRRLAGRAAMVLSGRRVVLGWGARFGLARVNGLGRKLAGWVKEVRWAC
jgi:hypothetical protein